jgi:class 3 adenylate cyclase
VLFPRWIMRLAVPVVAGLLLVITLAELGGLIPYAPLLAEAPFVSRRLSSGWMIGSGGIAFLILLVAVGLTYHIVYQWHDRERQLAESSEQLGRANDIISRYVASQLVSQVRSGKYDVLDRRERRKLTLFFSDIEGFAATADLTEPEDLATLLNEYLAEMTAIGERHGATIDKFVGDAIMIFFGAPVVTSDQDHAVRAVRMASEMQKRMTELEAKWRRQGFERPFRIRIGINTGHANIGNFGSAERMDYTAIGRQVNLAARLQTHCEPGRILISHSTWVLVQDDVACTPKGEIQVKGFHQPVRVYEVEVAAG